MSRFRSDDTILNYFRRFTQGEIEHFWRPLWCWLWNGVAAGVRQILRKHGKRMKVAEIYRWLVAAGYSFRSPNPRNGLTAQIYRMRGIRRTGPGEFSVK